MDAFSKQLWEASAVMLPLPFSPCVYDRGTAGEKMIKRCRLWISRELCQHTRWHGYAQNDCNGLLSRKFKDFRGSFRFSAEYETKRFSGAQTAEWIKTEFSVSVKYSKGGFYSTENHTLFLPNLLHNDIVLIEIPEMGSKLKKTYSSWVAWLELAHHPLQWCLLLFTLNGPLWAVQKWPNIKINTQEEACMLRVFMHWITGELIVDTKQKHRGR